MRNSQQSNIPESEGQVPGELASPPTNVEILAVVTAEVERLEQLIKWGFEHFETSLEYYVKDSNSFDSRFSPIDEDFQLIADTMNQTRSDFTDDEIEKLLLFADIYEATGEALVKIKNVIWNCISENNSSFHQNTMFREIWSRLSFPRTCDKSASKQESRELVINGDDLNAINKYSYFRMLLPLSIDYPSLCFKNLPLHLEDAKFIQKLIQPHLTSIRFENCPSIFSLNNFFHFDFSKLDKLSHFQFSNCYTKNLMPMLETIKSNDLIILDISKNFMPKENHQKLMNFLMSLKKLESLHVEGGSFEFPEITGEILKLKNLKTLNLTGNLDYESFSAVLNEVEKLNLENLSLFDFISTDLQKKIIENFAKLPNLKYLGMRLNQNESNFQCLCDNIKRLENLQVIESSSMIHENEFESLSKNLTKGKTTIRFRFRSEIFYSSVISQLDYLQYFYSGRMDMKNVEISDQNDFKGITEMSLKLSELENCDEKKYIPFFKKFKNLKTLVVDFENSKKIDWDILSILLNSNDIEDFTFCFLNSISDFEPLAKILQLKKLKTFTLAGNISKSKTTNNLIASIENALFWNELEELQLHYFSPECIILLFKTVTMSKLRNLKLVTANMEVGDFKFLPLPSLRKLDIRIDYRNIDFLSNKSIPLCDTLVGKLSSFLNCFPDIIDLTLDMGNFELLDPSILFGNIRKLKINCVRINENDFLSKLTELSFLTDLILTQSKEGQQLVRFVKHPKFKSLINSNVCCSKENYKKYFFNSHSFGWKSAIVLSLMSVAMIGVVIFTR